MNSKILNSSIIKKYKDTTQEMLHYNFPNLLKEEINEAIEWSIEKNFLNNDVTIFNNYINTKTNISLLDLSNYILDKKPIITSYGVLFTRHGTVPNPIYNMIQSFLDNRAILKNEMFKYPKGSDMFEKYDLAQLLAKLDSNALYGASGKFSCIYYNLHVAATTTTQGRSCNSAASLLFESILNNNVPFGSLNELIMFIYNVIKEDRKFTDFDILDNNISIEECLFKLLTSSGFGWIPSEKECDIVLEILLSLNAVDINRLFYKNNLFHFTDNTKIQNLIITMLQKLETAYVDPNIIPKEIEKELNYFYELIYEYVYYDGQIIDRLQKMESLIRSISCIMDTDSAIISFDGWYRYELEKTFNIPMNIKNQLTDPMLFLDDESVKENNIEIVKYEEYDFISDDIIEKERIIYPDKLIPQDGVRYSIINILAHCIGRLVNDYMYKYTINSNSASKDRKCLLIMKNEFLFKRVLITDAKKSYASYLEIQEGNMIPKDKALKITGLAAFIKSTMNETTRDKLKKILFEDILDAENIDQVKVIKEIAKIEKEIYNSIHNGEKLYYKPVRIKSKASYENPYRIQGIKASIAYNELHEQGTEPIDLDARNSVTIIKVNINPKNILDIKETHPEVYRKALVLMSTKEFDGSIDAVALPLNESVPKWVIPFVDYKSIINDNVSLFPLEHIGLNRGDKNNNYTNIIKF